MSKIFICLFGLLVALSACGKEKEVVPPKVADVAEIQVSDKLGEKPTITLPSNASPPTTLQTRDIVVGDGAVATNDKIATVHYAGVAWSNKQEFDASWNGGSPFPLQPPWGVIQGWIDGIPGMKVGGRRLLVIPPDLAYGPQGSPPRIIGGETLVFVVDLLKVG